MFTTHTISKLPDGFYIDGIMKKLDGTRYDNLNAINIYMVNNNIISPAIP